MKKKAKVYWSVRFRNWGADGPGYEYFRTKKEADEFAKQDYRDNPVRVMLTDPVSIERMEYQLYRLEHGPKTMEEAYATEILEIK